MISKIFCNLIFKKKLLFYFGKDIDKDELHMKKITRQTSQSTVSHLAIKDYKLESRESHL